MGSKNRQQIIKKGAEAWNNWRLSYPSITEPDLSGAKLDKRKLAGANLKDVDLASASLKGADLSGADLEGAYLVEANLSGANLQNANLRKAKLRATDLSKASLISANLQEAMILESYLNSADLSNAYLQNSQIIKTNLHQAQLPGANLFNTNLSMSDLTHANLTGANLQDAFLLSVDLSFANLHRANLTKAVLTSTRMVQTILDEAILSESNVYGISAWDLSLNNTIQENLIISQHDQPTKIMVDNLEVAQFIYLLLNHKKLQDIFNSLTQKGVLILGRFGGGGLDLLQSIAEKLRDLGYLPIIFDFERPDDRNLTETVQTLVGLSRFVIVDLSGPSVPHELQATVPHFKVPFVPIMERGRHPYSMFRDILENAYVLKPIVEFESKEELIEIMPTRIVAPAEDKQQARQKLLQQLFNR